MFFIISSIGLGKNVSAKEFDTTQIQALTTAINNQDWKAYSSLWTSDNKKNLDEYFADKNEQDGINYVILLYKNENGEMKLYKLTDPHYDMIQKYIIKSVKTTDSNYKKEEAALNIEKQCNNGYLVNENYKPITEDVKVVNLNANDSNNANPKFGISLRAVKMTWASLPKRIVTKGVKTDGHKHDLSFTEYQQHTLASEWFPYPTFSKENLKAGALCVKMVGWMAKIYPTDPANGIDITDNSQTCNVKKSYKSSNEAVSWAHTRALVNSSSEIWGLAYTRGTKGVAGNQHNAHLFQYGAEYLATKKNMDYLDILNYYYGHSKVSKESVMIKQNL